MMKNIEDNKSKNNNVCTLVFYNKRKKKLLKRFREKKQ